jgi:protein-tyrosine-phosphatase
MPNNLLNSAKSVILTEAHAKVSNSEFYLSYIVMSKEKTKILFVCMGNICRSPTAEGAFHSQMQKRGVQDLFEIDSAGTHAYHIGEQPDSRSQVAAHQYNVDLSSQRARQVHESDFYHYDYIFAMDGSNLMDLQDICPLTLVFVRAIKGVIILCWIILVNMFYVFFTNLSNKKLLARFSISNTSSKRPSKYGSGTPLPLFFGILSSIKASLC